MHDEVLPPSRRRYGLSLIAVVAATAMISVTVLSNPHDHHDEEPSLYLAKVRGRVLRDGQPVTNGTVLFLPDEESLTRGSPALAALDDQGRYVLSTQVGGDGAVVGIHKVGIVGLEPEAVNEGNLPDPSRDPSAFQEARILAIKPVTEPAVGPNEPYLTDRIGRRFRYVLPMTLASPEDSGITVTVFPGANIIDFSIDNENRVKVEQVRPVP